MVHQWLFPVFQFAFNNLGDSTITLICCSVNRNLSLVGSSQCQLIQALHNIKSNLCWMHHWKVYWFNFIQITTCCHLLFGDKITIKQLSLLFQEQRLTTHFEEVEKMQGHSSKWHHNEYENSLSLSRQWFWTRPSFFNFSVTWPTRSSLIISKIDDAHHSVVLFIYFICFLGSIVFRRQWFQSVEVAHAFFPLGSVAPHTVIFVMENALSMG